MKSTREVDVDLSLICYVILSMTYERDFLSHFEDPLLFPALGFSALVSLGDAWFMNTSVKKV